MPRLSRLPCLPPLREFVFIDQKIHATGAGIDPDAIAFTHQRQRAADECFWRDVADAHPAGGSGKTPIGDERDLLSHALSINQRGDAKHLAHARTADRTFVANNEHLALSIGAIADRIDAGLLIFEYAHGAFEQ